MAKPTRLLEFVCYLFTGCDDLIREMNRSGSPEVCPLMDLKDALNQVQPWSLKAYLQSVRTGGI